MLDNGTLKYYWAINSHEFRLYTFKRKILKNGLQISFAIHNDEIQIVSSKIGVGFTLNKLASSKIFVRDEDQNNKLINAYIFKSIMKTKNDLVLIFGEMKPF